MLNIENMLLGYRIISISSANLIEEFIFESTEEIFRDKHQQIKAQNLVNY
jgi:hypothetical protein